MQLYNQPMNLEIMKDVSPRRTQALPAPFTDLQAPRVLTKKRRPTGFGASRAHLASFSELNVSAEARVEVEVVQESFLTSSTVTLGALAGLFGSGIPE